MTISNILLRAFATLLVVMIGFVPTGNAQPGKRFKVTVKDEKKTIGEAVLPVDPQLRISLQRSSFMNFGLVAEGKRLTFSSGSGRPSFRIDGRVQYPTSGRTSALKPDARGKPRTGVEYLWQQGNLKVTHIQEVVPSRLPGRAKPGQKRKRDTVLFRYIVENKGPKPVKFGLRVRIDMYNNRTDGPSFAADTLPNKVINAMVMTGKQIPDYLKSIERPNLQAPGNVAYFTFKMGYKSELPSKLIPTIHGAQDLGWDVRAQNFNGDSDLVLYWADKVLKPGEKRDIAFGYGQGLATKPESEGRVKFDLKGSLQPQKVFSIVSYVHDPISNQTLKLELPEEIQLLEGPRVQPVPEPQDKNVSLVLWKVKALEPGNHLIRIRSSNGVNYGKRLIIEKAE